MTQIDHASTRLAMHRIAVHIVARARQQSTERFSLRVTPNGFGTPEFGNRESRVRVSGGDLIVESDAVGSATMVGRAIDGASLRDLADLAAVDLARPLDVGHDTPPLGDVHAPIAIDVETALELGQWFDLVGRVLDRVVVALEPDGSATTLPRLWPEHFDVAVETDARPGRRVNLGASPGDGFCHEPYLYVGPQTGDRPGDPSYWNAPFGAVLPTAALGSDAETAATSFLLDGVRRLA